MFGADNPDVTTAGAHRHRSRVPRFRNPLAATSLVAVAGLVVTSQAVLAPPGSAGVRATPGHHRASAAAVAPPPGSTWIEGVITDQADHGQDNVNVEAWPRGPGATSPAASSLSYGASPAHPGLQHGFFLLQVPSDHAYRIVFSAVVGREDGDGFRMKTYGHGRPIVVRDLRGSAGRIRDLGTVALARHGHVASRTKAVLARAKIPAGKRATLRVRVTSRFVTNVTGKVVVCVAGKKVTHRLTAHRHGRSSFKLPRVKKPGTYKVTASYAGSHTVHRSKAKPVRLSVRRH